ncbi:hypothetical protein [Enterococcus faecalis]|nr:hypothetical protein [Enterococcus faecalis]ELT8948062.1 hypothetical protein [Enterococcus faecalis]
MTVNMTDSSITLLAEQFGNKGENSIAFLRESEGEISDGKFPVVKKEKSN